MPRERGTDSIDNHKAKSNPPNILSAQDSLNTYTGNHSVYAVLIVPRKIENYSNLAKARHL